LAASVTQKIIALILVIDPIQRSMIFPLQLGVVSSQREQVEAWYKEQTH